MITLKEAAYLLGSEGLEEEAPFPERFRWEVVQNKGLLQAVLDTLRPDTSRTEDLVLWHGFGSPYTSRDPFALAVQFLHVLQERPLQVSCYTLLENETPHIAPIHACLDWERVDVLFAGSENLRSGHQSDLFKLPSWGILCPSVRAAHKRTGKHNEVVVEADLSAVKYFEGEYSRWLNPVLEDAKTKAHE